ncbi:sulfite exporter TauE/SafE family protein [Kineococcus sp. SYSU DK005]|uniref:sulfite exporter TauE/SafE family protein n=1 Tax=Kineococcus sp. SYSU DK005 TaxID=3383126 RepID=UPI003D7D33E2
MTPAEPLLLFAAGAGAGLVGSTAGLASLVSYPALLLTGLPPVVANVTNTVGLFGSTVGSTLGARPELRGQGRRLVRLLPAAVLGGAAGCALLLALPAGSFERVVPFLVALASLLLLLQPRVQRLRPGRFSERHPLVLLALFAVGVYGGYFGAAAGVMILALTEVLFDQPLARNNAVKNVLLGGANTVAAVGFALFADVAWGAALALGLGCLLGGRIGPVVVRHLDARVLRVVVALAGLGLAVRLWVAGA